MPPYRFSVIILHFREDGHNHIREDGHNHTLLRSDLLFRQGFFMALTLNDVEKIARLSRLYLDDGEKAQTLQELNDIFAMVEKMQSVNTDGIEPMAHPHEAALRLREDKITETDRAAEYQSVAPEVRNRLYIVPQVIEE